MPAFEVTLQTPGAFEGLTPPLLGATPFIIDPTQDLVIQWTPESHPGEQAGVTIQGAGPPSFAPEIDCFVDDSSGGLTISAQALATMAPTSAPFAGAGLIFFRSLAPTVSTREATLSVYNFISYQGSVLFE